ncbi:mitochondrial carrier domain-containing protein [Lasiosphaeria ovina]|uniref:Mitochondrial carrier domain-containing protein n=1 Tax=Lasiosphaeria ovina TaxID=92902 RepID=A0AAE0NJT1_9PEZI|nr:mitochondrial carrier domain-containing protein [Lasiosphaeria ovina]
MAPFGPRSTEPSDAQNHERIAHDGHGSGHGSSLGAIPSALRHVNDEPLPDPVEITAAQKMLSATSGSLLTGLLVTPLDVVRVRWQSQSVSTVASTPLPADFQRLALSTPSAFRPSNLGVTACCREVFFMNNTTEACLAGPRIGPGIVHNGGGVDCAVEQTQQRAFTSTIDGLRKIARNEGLTTLWRGLSPTLIMAVPANIIYFTGYDWLRYNTRSPIQRAAVRDEYAPLVAGALARVLAATAVGPIELFRTRMQASSSGSSTGNHLADTFRDIKQMVGLQGYSALWRGLTLTLWRDVPFSGMYWWGYEMIRGKLTDARERFKRASSDPLDLDVASNTISRQARSRVRRNSQSRENHTETFTDSFIAGALSGAFASVATMPFDVGKTRTQVFRDTGSAAAAAVPEERSMARLLWHIFSTEGAAGLFRGWIPRTLKVAPACAIMISSYEVGKRAFRGVNERALLKNEREP